MARYAGVTGKLCCLCAVLACALGLVTARAAGAAIPINEQKKILWRAIEEVLAENPAEIAQVRFIGVGSWMAKTATDISDIDITLGHEDSAIERRVDGAYRFVEDSRVFLDKVIKKGKPNITQAQKAAKYLNNYDSFLIKNLRLQLGDVSSLSRLSPEMQTWTRAMINYKRRLSRGMPEAEAERLLMRFLKIEDPAALERGMGEYVKKA